MRLEIIIPKLEWNENRLLKNFCDTVLINVENDNKEVVISGFNGVNELRTFESEFTNQLRIPINDMYKESYIKVSDELNLKYTITKQ